MRALLVLTLLALAGSAAAQTSDAPRPKRRVVPAPAAPAPPPPRAAPAYQPSGRLTLGGLAGLRGIDDRGASCRTACARTRYACEVQDDTCAAPWSACLKSCSDGQVQSLTPLLPPW